MSFTSARRARCANDAYRAYVTTGLDSATADLFPEHFDHGEDGMLPIGWRYARIGDLCAINAWTLRKKDDLKTLDYIEISEVSRGNISKIATYTRGEEPSRARRRLRHGDTVVSTVRPDRGSYFLSLNPAGNRVASTGAIRGEGPLRRRVKHNVMQSARFFERIEKTLDGYHHRALPSSPNSTAPTKPPNGRPRPRPSGQSGHIKPPLKKTPTSSANEMQRHQRLGASGRHRQGPRMAGSCQCLDHADVRPVAVAAPNWHNDVKD